MLDGTSHQGLKIAPVITALSWGVGVLSAPATARRG
jgi:hypothetical protein